jgi:hypothetical protein
MSPSNRSYLASPAPHMISGRAALASSAGETTRRERLRRAVGSDPKALLGVLSYWLTPTTGEGDSRVDP